MVEELDESALAFGMAHGQWKKSTEKRAEWNFVFPSLEKSDRFSPLHTEKSPRCHVLCHES